MFQNKDTDKPHTAKWATIIGGAIGLVMVIGVIFGKLPYECLFTLVAPLLGLGAMANRP